MFLLIWFPTIYVLLLTIFVTDHNSSPCFALQCSLACRCFWVVVVSEVRDHKTLASRDSQGTQFFQKKEKKLTGQVFGFIIRVGEIKLVFWMSGGNATWWCSWIRCPSRLLTKRDSSEYQQRGFEKKPHNAAAAAAAAASKKKQAQGSKISPPS